MVERCRCEESLKKSEHSNQVPSAHGHPLLPLETQQQDRTESANSAEDISKRQGNPGVVAQGDISPGASSARLQADDDHHTVEDDGNQGQDDLDGGVDRENVGQLVPQLYGVALIMPLFS